MNRALVPIMLIGVAGAPAHASKAYQDMTHAERVTTLNSIADECHLPRSNLSLGDGDELHFKPNRNALYEQVDCALTKLKGFKWERMGFVGNEKYDPKAH